MLNKSIQNYYKFSNYIVFYLDGDLQNLLNNISQQQLLQLFEGIGKIGGLSSLLGTMR